MTLIWSSLQPLGGGNLSVRVYQALREGLIAGKFHPGQRLVMQELANAFGTSVTPVREACLRLVSEDGLELRSGRFAMVPHATLPRYVEIRTIRIALEGLAAELACRHAKKSDIERLTQVQRRFEIAEKAGDAEAAARENRDFHFAVYRLSGLSILINQIEDMWVIMGPILHMYYSDMHSGYAGAEEHNHLIEALARRDPAAARAAIEQDILRAASLLSTP